jgi:Cd2+/Zn2+-exporting ATPase
MAVIRQNIGLALGVKAVFVVLTALSLATLWGAIAADVGATLLVTFNALRLLRAKAISQRRERPAEPALGKSMAAGA